MFVFVVLGGELNAALTSSYVELLRKTALRLSPRVQAAFANLAVAVVRCASASVVSVSVCWLSGDDGILDVDEKIEKERK